MIGRGEIWWASLPEPWGSEPGYRRPVVVVQSNLLNQSRINTALVAVLTSNLRLAEAPGNVQVSRRESGLPRQSVVNVSQVFAVDRRRLTVRIGRLPTSVMDEVDAGLRLVLSL